MLHKLSNDDYVQLVLSSRQLVGANCTRQLFFSTVGWTRETIAASLHVVHDSWIGVGTTARDGLWIFVQTYVGFGCASIPLSLCHEVSIVLPCPSTGGTQVAGIMICIDLVLTMQTAHTRHYAQTHDLVGHQQIFHIQFLVG